MMSSHKKICPLLLGAILIMLLSFSGCGDIKRSSRYYMPAAVQTFPSKPASVRLPVMEQPPKRPYLVIGKMNFECDEGPAFIYNSLQYNARKHGADAIIMRLKPKRPGSTDTFVDADMIVFQ